MTDKKIEEIRAAMARQDEVELPENLQQARDEAAEVEADHDQDRDEEEGEERDPDDRGPESADDEPDAPIDGDPIEPATLEELRRGAEYPLNDYGNGERFRLYFGRDCIWVPRVGWYVWTGQVWKKDVDGLAVRRKAQQIGTRIEQEAAAFTLNDDGMRALREEKGVKAELTKLRRQITGADEEEREPVKEEIAKLEARLSAIEALKRFLNSRRVKHRKFGVTSGNKGKIDALLNECGVGLAHSFDELDARDYDINTESGVLRFEIIKEEGMSGVAHVVLIPHAREQLNTKLMPVKFVPGARSALFDKFINRIQPAGTMREFLQRWFGLSCTGDTGEQKLAFFHGSGANGKSVLVDLMARIAGNYSAVAKIESLIGKNRRSAGDATPDLVPMMGARFVRASEPEEGERLQEAKIKELTGGEPLLVRALQEDFVEVTPKFKLTIQGNHKPDVRGTDDGIWRRLLLVPFPVQIPEEERDRGLMQKLWAEEERSGILNWIVEGLLDYMTSGLREPEEVIAATSAFREESDPIAAFLIECTVVSADPADFIRASELRESVQFWQKAKGEGAWGDRTVANKIKAKAGVWRHPSSGMMFTEAKRTDWGYRGIRLTEVFRAIFDKRPHGSSSSVPDNDQSWRDRSGARDDD